MLRKFHIATLAAALAATGGAGAASAQSMGSSGGEFNAGWGRSTGQENRGVYIAGGRDANHNRLIVDGVMQTGEDQSSYQHSSGSLDRGWGAGFGGSTAIGNNLSVVVQGSWNTVIVDSTQINNGDVTADSTLNGSLDFDDGE
jgi:holdfast attachment protein HfaA